MNSFDLKDVVAATGARVLGSGHPVFHGVGTDTRKDLSGLLFIALKGETYDAHDFLDKAVEAGATGLLVHRLDEKFRALAGRVPVFEVPDSLKGLQSLGHWNRRRRSAKILGITGSNGKTTSKGFCVDVIGSRRGLHASAGSFNNHWGVPLTLLEIAPEHQVAVVEMGMNHAGELTELVGIADPDIVVCTTVGRAHVEHFSGIGAIAAAKEEIYLAARPDAMRIFNLDNPWTRDMSERSARSAPSSPRLVFSSEDERADVHLRIERLGVKDLSVSGHILGTRGAATIPVFGEQNLVNLMVAAAGAAAVGLSPLEIWQGLELCRTQWGRNQFVHLKSGAEMIFDGYNANPDSMKALMTNVRRLSTAGRKIGVFGQMRELGSQSPELHEEIGRAVGEAGFDKVYFIGDDVLSFEKGLRSVSEVALLGRQDFGDDMAADLVRALKPGDLIVVKASRGTRIERFVKPCQPLNFGEKDG